MKNISTFVRKEPVFVVAFVAAIISCFFVPIDKSYLDYIDMRTLALLYALMVVISGFTEGKFFILLTRFFCSKCANFRSLGTILIGLCFFSSMLITNDVALLTFVPFSLMVMQLVEQTSINVIVLEIVAANLGSMLTPIGNPQNLYLFSFYNYSIFTFLKAVMPIWLAALILLFISTRFIQKKEIISIIVAEEKVKTKDMIVYTLLLILCLLVVFHVLRWQYMLLLFLITLLLYNKSILLKADFVLLLTFVCFFVFSGNLAKINRIHKWIQTILYQREYFVSVLLSQVISNVPTALLLSGFTAKANTILLGVNIGGLGTPIASLASLIGIKFYSKAKNANIKKFMFAFMIINFIFLILLSLAHFMLNFFNFSTT